MNPPRRLLPTLLLCGSLLLVMNASIQAGSATWNLNPTSGDWNTPANWTPNSVPNGPLDTATFDVSTTTSISLTANTEVNSIVFEAGASPFVISVLGQGTSPSTLTISGVGVVNNSGITQRLVTGPAASGGVGNITLTGNATIGQSMMVINSKGGSRQSSTVTTTTFADNTSAGDATVFIEGGASSARPHPGYTKFTGSATAAEGTFLCGRAGKKAFGGAVHFSDSSTAANGTFVLEGAVVADGRGGSVLFYDTSTAGNGVFTIDGTDVAAVGNGYMQFYDTSSAGNATLIANDGRVDGGEIDFFGESTGGTARFELFGKGTLNLTDFQTGTPRTVGSIEGDGVVLLGRSILTIGSNSLSTTFSGTIEGTGAITKIGSGTLTLGEANTYTGGTTVSEGMLAVTNGNGSATGTGTVMVNAGILGGSGIVSGAVAVGTGAFLAPAANTKIPTTFTTTGLLFLQADATYIYTLRAKPPRSQADRVIANEVTISGAKFAFQPKISGTLQAGTVFTAISNTSSNPIIGTFSDLPDGAIVTVNGNNFQANYEGGDGNDLTLTVVP